MHRTLRAVSGKASRRKGHDFERDVAARLRGIGLEARRGQQGGGPVEPDVITPGWWIECKVGKRPNITAALDQAERDCEEAAIDRFLQDAPPGQEIIPVAIVRQDYQKATVTMRLDDWLGLACYASRHGEKREEEDRPTDETQ